MYQFSKRIKCLCCEGNFRGITERGKRKYICASYHNYRTCFRWRVNESDLLEIANQGYSIMRREPDMNEAMLKVSGEVNSDYNEFLSSKIDKIEVNPNTKECFIYFVGLLKATLNDQNKATWERL